MPSKDEATLTINMDQPCRQCGKLGATQVGDRFGVCLECAAKNLKGKEGLLMDSVLLVDQSDPTRLYQQACAVGAQRSLYDLKAMTEDADEEVLKAVKSAIDRTNQLVGLLLASRLVVRKPVQAPQVTLEEYAKTER